MKIAIVSDAAYPFTRGGRETRYYEIARRLVRRGHDVHLFTFKWWRGEEAFVQDGIVYHGATPPRLRRFVNGRRSITEALHFAATVPLLLRGHRFDVVECDEFPYVHFPFVYLATRSARTPIVSGWWECWDKYWYEYLGPVGGAGWLVERGVVRLADWIVVETEYNKRILSAWRFPERRIVVIPSGVDFRRAQDTPPAPTGHDVLFLGRLLRTKGVYTLVEALGHLRQSGRAVSAGIIGDGPERDRLHSLVSERGLRGAVTLYGRVESNEEVYAIMKASKVFVYPVVMEGGWAVSAVEAQACGLPVVTFSGGALGACEVIRDGHNGVLLAGNDAVRELAEAIWVLLSNEPLRRQMKGRAVEFARARDWDTVSESVEHLYQTISRR